ncbi:uncharacterized protein CCR75_005136 [Bremia lactucae]|uniref:AAA+ ATPase domain-containing protein n=1 Tax=Bremia lactucae TaxID=4779 RepID=A0A976IG76_BRELC|nr:hypothetical protein CCR75_005136 [Bremia lactucae]
MAPSSRITLLSAFVQAAKVQARHFSAKAVNLGCFLPSQKQHGQCLSTFRFVTSSGGPKSYGNKSIARIIALAGSIGVTSVIAQMEAGTDKNLEKRFEYAEAVDTIRQQVAEFRLTLRSFENRYPKEISINKIESTRICAPNGVSTIRIEFACPSFVNQEAILGRFLLQLHEASTFSSRQIVEVIPTQLKELNKSIKTQPAVTYLYTNGSGSFQFLRNFSPKREITSKFIFYKDSYLTQAEIDAVVGAYKEMYSLANVEAFNRYYLDQRQNSALIERSRSPTNIATAISGKEEAIQQLQSLGISVFEPAEEENCLTWESLAGNDKLKSEIEDTVVLALQNPELYENIAQKTRCRYESNRPRAVLFEGPPGTGKTLSARIIAQQAGIPMIHIPIESVVSKWYGESERKMSTIFEACDKLEGVIIFIDEIDALAGDRSCGTMHEASRRLLSVLLQKVEGFASAKKTTLVCATNRKQDLDAALISRFDLCIHYDLPDEISRHAVFRRYAKQLSNEEISQLASVSSQLSCRDIKEICEYAERKWASKLLKKEETTELPTMRSYMDAVKNHMDGRTIQGSHRIVYEA